MTEQKETESTKAIVSPYIGMAVGLRASPRALPGPWRILRRGEIREINDSGKIKVLWDDNDVSEFLSPSDLCQIL
ncbi:MAG: hypothetical protein UW75_C0053G0006 [Parcubacteria group bacterium GW2011_GWF2_44_8]|nr:MAG: hypothetical protein UW75_C0053G0006 [Parcubacteria group bacterium GW2011_GWF2_44_8]